MTLIVYLLLFIALILAMGLWNSMRSEEHHRIIASPFKDKWANKLHHYSYYVPFVWFIDGEEKDQKTKDLKKKITEANLNHVLNYRSFTTFRVGMFICSVVLFLIVLYVFHHGGNVAKFLFHVQQVGISVNAPKNETKPEMMVAIVLGILQLAPSWYLKRRIRKYRYYNIKDIPILQLFIILMLRSKKPVEDVLFALTKLNTRYKPVFETGYLMYLRSPEDGFEYIKSNFVSSNFQETLNVLRDMGEYSREDSIRLLENNMQQIVEKNNAEMKSLNANNLAFSQMTLAVPFIAVVVLAFLPLAVWGISLFSKAGLNF